jgi:hypothetical protein
VADQLNYLELAEACFKVARSSGDPENQKLLLAMANDYMARAKEAPESEKMPQPNGIDRRVLN